MHSEERKKKVCVNNGQLKSHMQATWSNWSETPGMRVRCHNNIVLVPWLQPIYKVPYTMQCLDSLVFLLTLSILRSSNSSPSSASSLYTTSSTSSPYTTSSTSHDILSSCSPASSDQWNTDTTTIGPAIRSWLSSIVTVRHHAFQGTNRWQEKSHWE